MRDENFEIGLTAAKTAKKETASAKTAAGGGGGEASKEDANEDDEDEEMASDVEEGSNFESEDDPERLWCVCQQVIVPIGIERSSSKHTSMREPEGLIYGSKINFQST